MSELDRLEAKRDEALSKVKDARRRLRRWQTAFDTYMDAALRAQDGITKLQAEAKAIARRLTKTNRSLTGK